MGLKIPFANLYMNGANELNEVGVEGSKGLVHICYHDVFPFFKYPGYDKFFKAWNDQWKKWKTKPFNSPTFEYISEFNGAFAIGPYWLFSVIERARTLDPEKIIRISGRRYLPIRKWKGTKNACLRPQGHPEFDSKGVCAAR